MEARSLDQMLAANPIATVQAAIVTTLKGLLPGVSIVLHPGKVDLSELVAKSVVAAPGIGIGWSRVIPVALPDVSFSAQVFWTAYVVAEARVVAGRRVEKEAVGLAIGQQLVAILFDDASFWGCDGVLPPEKPEMKPLFTIRDAAQGTIYYTVTWSQVIADIGEPALPTATATVDAGALADGAAVLDYEHAADMLNVTHFIPAAREDDDA
jgi:hypothetical protein